MRRGTVWTGVSAVCVCLTLLASSHVPHGLRFFSADITSAVEFSQQPYWNRTPPGAQLLVYNRVPKCGSSTLVALLKRLAAVNKFEHHSSELFHQRRLSDREERTFVHKVAAQSAKSRRPLSLDRHFYYANFTKYGLERPAFINLVREPVQRFVSTFYYLRSMARWERLTRARARNRSLVNLRVPRSAREGFYQRLLVARKGLELAASPWARKQLVPCVLNADPECSFAPGHPRETQISFFCGSHPECLIVGSKTALQRAKASLEEAYSVVGVLEELEGSLAVMEALLPRFMANATGAFAAMRASGESRANETPHPATPAAVHQVLRANLSTDIEFYEFARQRLHSQIAALGIALPSAATSVLPPPLNNSTDLPTDI